MPLNGLFLFCVSKVLQFACHFFAVCVSSNIEGLRIGEYTVSEVSDSASAGYILPADKQATVKTDSTTIVEMHNEFRDTPKTGDDFNLGLWVSLAAASVIGAGVLGFVGFKKKKKED